MNSVTSVLPDYDVPATNYGADEPAMARYREQGLKRALLLDNRGPLQFDSEGNLQQSILESYWEHGFYIFEGLLQPVELQDLEQDVATLLDRAPIDKDSAVDHLGRPALGSHCTASNLGWVKPLSDAFGGTSLANGRHPAKMVEPEAPAAAPARVLQIVLGSLQFSDACLRLYAHPQLLRVAEAINGPDFTPFNEAVWIKHPRLGGSVAWHQDGWTHWDSPEFDAGTHGFNFMAQLYGCNADNGLWVVPGSHKHGKANIKALVESAGSDRIADAVPLICAPGDVAICNRQAIHGSFANTSDKPRVTINFGFHRRKSVLGVVSGGVHNAVATYDDARIRERSKVIMLARSARLQRFPNEEPYHYQPFAGEEADYQWTAQRRNELRDYNLLDLGI